MPNGILFHPGECEVCGRSRDVAVSASPWGPMSYSHCKECLARPAEPLFVFKYLYDEVAEGDPSRLDARIKNWYTWIDGRYVHWTNYVERRKNEK